MTCSLTPINHSPSQLLLPLKCANLQTRNSPFLTLSFSGRSIGGPRGVLATDRRKARRFILCFQCILLIFTIPWAVLKRVSPVPVTTPTLQTLLAVSAVLSIMMTDYWCGFSAYKGRSNTVLAGKPLPTFPLLQLLEVMPRALCKPQSPPPTQP